MDQIASLTKRGDDGVRSLRPGTGLENFDADAALLHVLLSRLEQQEDDARSKTKILSQNRSSSTNTTNLHFQQQNEDDGHNDTSSSSSTAISSNLIRLLHSQHQQQGDRVDSTAFYHTSGLGASPPSHLKGAISAENLSSFPIDVRRQVGRLRSEYDIGRATLLRMIKAVSELLNKYQQSSTLNKELERELIELRENHGEIAKELRRMKLAKKYLGADSTHHHTAAVGAHRNDHNNNNGNNAEFEEAWKLESEASAKEVDEYVRGSVEHFKTLVLLHRHSKTLASIICPDAPIAAAEEAEAQMISAHIEEESRLAKILAEKLKNNSGNPFLMTSNSNGSSSSVPNNGNLSSKLFLNVPGSNNNNNKQQQQQRTNSGKFSTSSSGLPMMMNRSDSIGGLDHPPHHHHHENSDETTTNTNNNYEDVDDENDENHNQNHILNDSTDGGGDEFIGRSGGALSVGNKSSSANTSMNEKIDLVVDGNANKNNNNTTNTNQVQRSKTPMSVFGESNTSVPSLDDDPENNQKNLNNNNNQVPLTSIDMMESNYNSLNDGDFQQQQQQHSKSNHDDNEISILPFSQLESKFQKQEKMESKLHRKYIRHYQEETAGQKMVIDAKHPNLRRSTRKELLNVIRSIDSKNDSAVELKNTRRLVSNNNNENDSSSSFVSDLGNIHQHQPPQRKKMSDVLKAVDSFLTEWGPKSNNNNSNNNANGGNNINNDGDFGFFNEVGGGDGNNNNNDEAAILISFRRCRGGVAEYQKYSGSDLRRRINYSQQFAIAACRSEHHTMQVDNFEERIENITVLRRTHPHHQQLIPPNVKPSSNNNNAGDENSVTYDNNTVVTSSSTVKQQHHHQKSSSSNNNNNRRGFQVLHPEDYAALSQEDQEDYRIQLEHNKNIALRAARGERLRTLVRCRPEDRRVISLATMLVETLSQNKSPFVIIRSVVPDETVLSRATMRSHGLGPIWQVGGEATFCVASCPLPLLHQTVSNNNNNNSIMNHQAILASNSQIRASVSTFQLSTTTDPGEAASTPGIISFLSSFVVPKEVTAKYETAAAKAEAARRYLLRENYMRCYASSALPGTLTSALIGPYVDPSRPFFVTSNESGGEYVEIFFARAVVYPSGYSFASCHVSGAAAFPRFWRLEASADSGVTWTLLKRHVDDKTLHNGCPRAAWAIDPPSATATTSSTSTTEKANPNGNNHHHQSQVFSRFRISIEGPNSSGTWHINASCIEIYGRVLTLQSAATSLVAQESVPFLTTPSVVATVSAEGKGASKVSFSSSGTNNNNHNTNNSNNNNSVFYKPSTTFTNSYAGLGAPPAAFVPQIGKKEKAAGGKKASPVRKR